MPPKPESSLKLEFHPVTPERWDDLEHLFGKRGACGGCWCMWWKLKRSEFEKWKGEGNRKALKQLMDSGEAPGLLAYLDGEPVGWCAVAPREAYPVLDRSRILKRVDDEAVWSIVCFFVARNFRRKQVTTELLKAAVQYGKDHGARIVEVFTGTASAFLKAGLVEVVRRSETRPIMRYVFR